MRLDGVGKAKSQPAINLADRLAGHVETVKKPMTSSGEPMGRFEGRIRRARANRETGAVTRHRVDKSIMSILRKPKAAQPIIRSGVTRAGTVGVEFEHQGVKGWGRDMEAARMSWQQNRAMAKRHDVGKSDSWEVPMDHFSPALPQRRPNYGTGNTVGKRMTGAVTGVAKPKKIQPTRTAPRKAAGMLPIGTPPIAPSLVGKSLRTKLLLPPKGKDSWQVRNAANRMENNPLGYDGGVGSRAVEDEMKRRRRVRQAGTISGSGVAAFAGARAGSHRKETASKRDRRYNPEASRQRRIGGAAALATGAGALLTHRGVKGIREATQLARRGIPFAPTSGRPAVILEEEGKAKRVIPVPERVRVRADDLHRRGITASRSDLGSLGGGVGLMGGGVGINHYGRSRANREHR